MPDISQTLQGSDLGFLRIVASAWGFDLNAPDAASALPLLINLLRTRQLIQEMLDTLPADAIEALHLLMANEGHLSWAEFTRKFGEVRLMGPGRRDRERPDRKPISTSEILWYRALIGKAFLHFPPQEPQEYIFIPDDLVGLLRLPPSSTAGPLGRPASPGETAVQIPATDVILDHTCTLLAGLRNGFTLAEVEPFTGEMPHSFMLALLRCAVLIDGENKPIPETVRAFLEAGRSEALSHLAQVWNVSSEMNDLLLLPGLKFEGEWDNHPLQTRQLLLSLVSQVPAGAWWNIQSFVEGVKSKNPDYQRPAGDYDSWFIRRESDGIFLRGFGTWDEVDGALIRYLITGPLHWLGFVDLAAAATQPAPAAFRFSGWAADLWNGQSPPGLAEETGQAHISSDGRLRMEALSPRPARYQVARFCHWDGVKNGEYLYSLTTASLERAHEQGLRSNHLITILRRLSPTPLPPSLLQALERFEKFGSQASVQKAVLLRLSSPEVVAALRKSRAARFLGEALNDTTLLIKPGGEAFIRQALAELGYLLEE